MGNLPEYLYLPDCFQVEYEGDCRTHNRPLEECIHAAGAASRDAEVAVLRQMVEQLSACLCGCPIADHENYGEDGESCGHDDHDCIRVFPAVVEALKYERANHNAEVKQMQSKLNIALEHNRVLEGQRGDAERHSEAMRQRTIQAEVETHQRDAEVAALVQALHLALEFAGPRSGDGEVPYHEDIQAWEAVLAQIQATLTNTSAKAKALLAVVETAREVKSIVGDDIDYLNWAERVEIALDALDAVQKPTSKES